MKVLLLSHYLENYQKLADVVNTNKEEYCKIHGYDYRAMVGHYVDAPFGFQRIKAMLDIMVMGTYNIIWWTDIDSIILNFTKRIEDFVDDDHDFYITRDVHLENGGSVIVKNTQKCREWLKYIWETRHTQTHEWVEQKSYQENMNHPDYKDIIKILPQNDINSYLYTLYARPDTTEGHVKKGDLLLHIPGSSLEDRINIFNSQQIKDLTIR